MLTKENYDDIKWDMLQYSTKGMHKYIKESTIEKVWIFFQIIIARVNIQSKETSTPFPNHSLMLRILMGL